MTAPHSILVAIDDSRQAQEALERAIQIAVDSGAWLTIMHVVAPLRMPLFISPYVAGGMEPESDEFAERLVDRALAQVPEGIPVHVILGRGDVAEEILRRVNVAGHDLVVMGSRGLGLVRRALLGSVSRAVLHRSPVPVIVVHTERGSSPPGLQLRKPVLL